MLCMLARNCRNYGVKAHNGNMKNQQSPSFIDIMSSILAEDKNPALFSMVVWTIWNQRNNSRLGKPTTSIPQLLEQARDRLREFSNLHNPVSPSTATPASCWRPPNQGCFKINFDGTLFSKENRARIGVVVHNKEGLVLASLSQQIPLPATVLEVETLATRRALEFAIEIGVHELFLKGIQQFSSMRFKAPTTPWLTLVTQQRMSNTLPHVSKNVCFLMCVSTVTKLLTLQLEEHLKILICQFEWKIYHQTFLMFFRLI